MMDKQERLRERYEDALFAIMMDELASSLGKEAEEENERLKNDPNATVPEQIDKRCLKTIRNHYRKAAARHAGRVTLKTLACFAMTLGVASALFVGAFAASEQVRIRTLNLVVETFGESTDFYFAPSYNGSVSQIKAGWMLDGFTMQSEGSDDVSSWFLYCGPESQRVRGFYYLEDGQVVGVDTEGAEVIPTHINGSEAMLSKKGDSLQIIWATPNKTGFINLVAEGITVDEFIRIAENIIF